MIDGQCSNVPYHKNDVISRKYKQPNFLWAPLFFESSSERKTNIGDTKLSITVVVARALSGKGSASTWKGTAFALWEKRRFCSWLWGFHQRLSGWGLQLPVDVFWRLHQRTLAPFDSSFITIARSPEFVFSHLPRAAAAALMNTATSNNKHSKRSYPDQRLNPNTKWKRAALLDMQNIARHGPKQANILLKSNKFIPKHVTGAMDFVRVLVKEWNHWTNDARMMANQLVPLVHQF